MSNYDYYVGIDPDAVKSGVAVVERETRICDAQSLPFHSLLNYLVSVKEQADSQGKRMVVIVEAGWLNESNWHIVAKDSKPMAAAKGKSLGRCEQTGRLILEMAESMGMECVARKPLRKCWKGKDRKITHEEIHAITNIACRTNQEARDALLLAWVEADLPLYLGRGFR